MNMQPRGRTATEEVVTLKIQAPRKSCYDF